MIKRIYLSETVSKLAIELSRNIATSFDIKQVSNDVQIGTETSFWEQYAETVATIRELRPDYIIILPGHTAFKIENLALSSQLIGARVVYVSDTEVFDGMKSVPEQTNLYDKDGNEQVRMRFVPYDEYDFPRPSTSKGMNALHGEQYVQRYVRRYTIIRPGFLFDPDEMKTIKPKELIPYGNPMISPTLISDFATAIFKVIDDGLCGIYHISNAGKEMTILELIQYHQPFIKYDLIQPKQGQMYCHNQMITGNKLADRTGLKMPELNWKEKQGLRVVK